tara:strand:- start:49 stop:348 length:300 start_codon:yes stop_codon:yes gene_type:complete
MDRLSGTAVCLTLLAICATPAWGSSSPPRCRQVDSASVTVACTLRDDGSLTDCAVVRESAPGCGFAEQAIAGAARARLRLSDTARPGQRVEMTMQFRSP